MFSLDAHALAGRSLLVRITLTLSKCRIGFPEAWRRSGVTVRCGIRAIGADSTSRRCESGLAGAKRYSLAQPRSGVAADDSSRLDSDQARSRSPGGVYVVDLSPSLSSDIAGYRIYFHTTRVLSRDAAAGVRGFFAGHAAPDILIDEYALCYPDRRILCVDQKSRRMTPPL